MKNKYLQLAFILTGVVSFAQVLEDFDNVKTGNWTYQGANTGTFDSTATPPTGNTTVCGYVQRMPGAGNEFDNIQYTLFEAFSESQLTSLSNGNSKMKLKLATTASVGITVKIKIEGANGEQDFHSEYDAITTKGGANEWEELTFEKNENAVGTLPANQARRLVIFFAFFTTSGDQFFFDDLKIESVTRLPKSSEISSVNFYPNPSNGVINFEVEGAFAAKVFNSNGEMVKNINIQSPKTLQINDLRSGLYQIVLFDANNQALRSGKIIIND